MAQIHASAKQGNGIIRSLYDSNEWKYKKFVKKKEKKSCTLSKEICFSMRVLNFGINYLTV
jgi:hypothetical protein